VTDKETDRRIVTRNGPTIEIVIQDIYSGVVWTFGSKIPNYINCKIYIKLLLLQKHEQIMT